MNKNTSKLWEKIEEETVKASTWRYTTPDTLQDLVGKMKYKIGERLSDGWFEEYEIKGYAIGDENDKELGYLVGYDYGGYEIMTEEELEKHFVVIRGEWK